MRIRLKTRVILGYLSAVSLATIIFGFYFLLAPPVSTVKSRNGIERAARDSLSEGGDRSLLFLKKKKPDLFSLLFKPGEKAKTEKNVPKVENLEKIAEKEQVLAAPDGKVILPPKDQLANMSWEALSSLYHSYTQQIQVPCAAIKRLGRVTDGGWEVCEDEPYRPVSPCLVYSFGVGDDFSFDDAVAKRYGCEVHSFDPSMNAKDHQRPSSARFHALGLADFSGQALNGWKMSTLSEIREMLGHSKTPLSVLKLDIEEWEWKVLPSLLEGGQLSDTTQVLMELHQCDGCSQYNPAQLDKEPPKQRYVQALGILRDLYNLGFRIFWQHQNRACSYVSRFSLTERHACCELHLVRSSSG